MVSVASGGHNAAKVFCAGVVVSLLKEFHVAFAYVTVAGFVARAALSLAGSPLLAAKWIRIAPHVIDTLLLACGVGLAITLSLSPLENPWLAAKIVGLLAYIGFGVLTLRARSRGLKTFGFVAALASVGYVFAAAYSKTAMPF